MDAKQIVTTLMLLVLMSVAMTTEKATLVWSLSILRQPNTDIITGYLILLIIVGGPYLFAFLQILWNVPFIAVSKESQFPGIENVLLGCLVCTIEAACLVFFAVEVAPIFPVYVLLPILNSVLLIPMLVEEVPKLQEQLLQKIDILAVVVRWQYRKWLQVFACMVAALLPSGLAVLLYCRAAITGNQAVVLGTTLLGLSIVNCPVIQRYILAANGRLGNEPKRITLFYTLVKLSAMLFFLAIHFVHRVPERPGFVQILKEFTEGFSNILRREIALPLTLNYLSAIVSHGLAFTALSWCLPLYGLLLPSVLSVVGAIAVCCGFLDPALISDQRTGELNSFAIASIVALLIWCAPYLLTTLCWIKKPDYLFMPFEALFMSYGWNNLFFDQYLLLGYRRETSPRRFSDRDSESGLKVAAETKSRIFVCTTMYREADYEMERLLMSLQGLSFSTKFHNVFLEAHIFMDNGCTGESINAFAQQLVDLISAKLGLSIQNGVCIQMPYGIQITWTLNGGMPLIVHFKDTQKVKVKKRWSQAMYVQYILNFRIKIPPSRKEVTGSDSDQSSYADCEHKVCDKGVVKPLSYEEIKRNSLVLGGYTDIGKYAGQIEDRFQEWPDTYVVSDRNLERNISRIGYPTLVSHKRLSFDSLSNNTDTHDQNSAQRNKGKSFLESVLIPVTDSTLTETSDSTLTHMSDSTLTHSSDSTLTHTSDYTLTQSSDYTLTQTSDSIQTHTSDSIQTQTSDSTLTHTSDSTLKQTSDSTLTQTSDSTLTQTSDSTLTQASDSTLTQTSDSTQTQTSGSTLTHTSESTLDQTSEYTLRNTPDSTLTQTPNSSQASSTTSLVWSGDDENDGADSSEDRTHLQTRPKMSFENEAFVGDDLRKSPKQPECHSNNKGVSEKNVPETARPGVAENNAVISKTDEYIQCSLEKTTNDHTIMPQGMEIQNVKDGKGISSPGEASAVTPENNLTDNFRRFEDVPNEVMSEDHIYILATDADMEFNDDAVLELLHVCNNDKRVGAACGRTHPQGKKNSLIVWHQIFEYAKDFWMIKNAQNVIGSVMCCPGCFSLYRASAIREVMDKYVTPTRTPFNVYVKDTGEDRWLATLMMVKGWYMRYSCFARNNTFCPDTFEEFLKQRRRWVLSDIANSILVVQNLLSLMRRNACFSLCYILYLLNMFLNNIITPGTAIVMITAGLDLVFRVPYLQTTIPLAAVVFAYAVLCTRASTRTQTRVTTVLTVVMGAVFFAVVVWGSATIVRGIVQDIMVGKFNFQLHYVIMLITLSFGYAAAMHPSESYMVIYGLAYVFVFPAMHILLPIYSIANIIDQSWGTRDAQEAKLPKIPCIFRCIARAKKKDNPKLSDPGETKSSSIVGELKGLEEGDPPYQVEFDFWLHLRQSLIGTDVNTGLGKSELVEKLRRMRNRSLLGILTLNGLWLVLLSGFYMGITSPLSRLNIYGIISGVLYGFTLVIQMLGITACRLDHLVRYLGRIVFGHRRPFWIHCKDER